MLFHMPVFGVLHLQPRWVYRHTAPFLRIKHPWRLNRVAGTRERPVYIFLINQSAFNGFRKVVISALTHMQPAQPYRFADSATSFGVFVLVQVGYEGSNQAHVSFETPFVAQYLFQQQVRRAAGNSEQPVIRAHYHFPLASTTSFLNAGR